MMITTRDDTRDRPGTPSTTIDPGDPAASAIRSAFAEGRYWLVFNTPRAVASDPKGVHHLRTTTRRLRSALDLFRGLTDPGWAAPLADDLKWLAAALGAVRDLDVLGDRLNAAAEGIGRESVEALAPLFEELRERHDRATAELRATLRGTRFHGILGRVAFAAGSAPLAEGAWTPCREALPPLVAAAWKDLKRAGRALEPPDPDEDFHSARKKAKRARYAAEAVAQALDPGAARAAARFALKAKRVQDALGGHQDATVTGAFVRDAAAARPDLGPFNFAAGRLLEREARAAEEARARFFRVWLALDRKKAVKWLKV